MVNAWNCGIDYYSYAIYKILDDFIFNLFICCNLKIIAKFFLLKKKNSANDFSNAKNWCEIAISFCKFLGNGLLYEEEVIGLIFNYLNGNN